MSSLASIPDSSSDLTERDRIEMLKDRASAIIAEKDAAIARLNREIDEAEKLFERGLQTNVDEDAQLNHEIAKLETELRAMDLRAEREIQALREQYADEIKAIMAKQQKELETLHKEIAERNENDVAFQKCPPKFTTLSLSTTASSQQEPSEVSEASHSPSQSSTELHVVSARQKAEETAREVEKLEAELRRATLFRQQQIAEQAEKMREEEEKQRNERRERQKKIADTELAHKKAEYDQAINDLREELQNEADAMKDKLQKLVNSNDRLDSQIAETLAENDERECQLDRVRQAKHNASLSYSSTGLSSIHKKPARKVSPNKLRQASMFPEFSVLDAEIIRLRDENDELRRIIKKLDKCAYIRSPH